MSTRTQKLQALSKALTRGESPDMAVLHFSANWGVPPQEVQHLLKQIIDQAHSPLASPSFQALLPALREATSVTDRLLEERNLKRIEHRIRLMEAYKEACRMTESILDSLKTPEPREFATFYTMTSEEQTMLLAEDRRLHCRDPQELARWEKLKLATTALLAKLDGFLGARGDMVLSQTQHANGSMERSVAFRGLETTDQVSRALQLLNGKPTK